MRFKTLLLLFVLTPIITFCQDNFVLDSIYRSYWQDSSSDLELTTIDTFQYLTGENFFQVRISIDDDKRILTSKKHIMHNENGSVTISTKYNYDDLGECFPDSKNVNEFDENNNRISLSILNYDVNESVWEEFRIWEYLDYDLYGNFEQQVLKDINDSGEFEVLATTENQHFYKDDNLDSLIRTAVWVGGYPVVQYFKYSYSPTGQLVKELEYSTPTFLYSEVNYLYDVNGNLIEELTTRGNSTSRKRYEYDISNNLILEYVENLNPNMDWDMTVKIQYFWTTEVVSLIENIEGHVDISWQNLGNQGISFQVKGLEIHGSYSLSIFDASGKELSITKIKGETNYNNNVNTNFGTYFLRLTDKKNNSIVVKMIGGN